METLPAIYRSAKIITLQKSSQRNHMALCPFAAHKSKHHASFLNAEHHPSSQYHRYFDTKKLYQNAAKRPDTVCLLFFFTLLFRNHAPYQVVTGYQAHHFHDLIDNWNTVHFFVHDDRGQIRHRRIFVCVDSRFGH